MDLVYLFLTQFLTVQLMILNSKLVQNDRIYIAMLNSWLITGSQYMFIHTVATSPLGVTEKVLVSGLGGSLGVGLGYYLYKRFLHKEGESK